MPDGEEKYFGGKVITLTGGIALLLNNATGPGLVQIPLLFQQSGWLPSVAMFLSSFALSVLSALMLVEATSRIPGDVCHASLTRQPRCYLNLQKAHRRKSSRQC